MKSRTSSLVQRAGLIAMVAGPVAGIAAMILAMQIELDDLSANMPPGDPSHVSKPIGYVLLFPIAGLGFGLAGWFAARLGRKPE